jgi:hypothetical protein
MPNGDESSKRLNRRANLRFGPARRSRISDLWTPCNNATRICIELHGSSPLSQQTSPG